MPLHLEQLAQELQRKKTELSNNIIKEETIDRFQAAVKQLKEKFDYQSLKKELESINYPGAVPSIEYESKQDLIVPFKTSSSWNSHEAVNNWAREQLENKPVIAADGSQINPITEFEQVISLVQVVWLINNHTISGDYQENVETIILSPEDLLNKNSNGYLEINEQEVHSIRFETEARVLEEEIKNYAEREVTPLILYDGSLILSFMQRFNDEEQKRYAEALTRLLAASKKYKVPVVSYISGSKGAELATMIEQLKLATAEEKVRDYQLLHPLFDHWGARTILFSSRRDSTLKQLKVNYEAKHYDFSQDILFSYLNIGPGPQLDRVEMPSWILEEGLVEEIFSLLRAQVGIGRGYPEILQEVDSDVVLTAKDKEKFLKIYQQFAAENNIDLTWNNKALSKQRRRG